eukprot:3725530-Rhodomonas_salina.1
MGVQPYPLGHGQHLSSKTNAISGQLVRFRVLDLAALGFPDLEVGGLLGRDILGDAIHKANHEHYCYGLVPQHSVQDSSWGGRGQRRGGKGKGR